MLIGLRGGILEVMGNLSKPYRLRLPEDVAERYEHIAKTADMTISAVLRKVLAEDKEIVITQPDPKRQEDRARVMRILGNAGNNLNQIARHLNILSKQGDLRYSEAVHYLYLLENIEAQFNVTLQIYNHADPG